jgi:hypothetical protein
MLPLDSGIARVRHWQMAAQEPDSCGRRRCEAARNLLGNRLQDAVIPVSVRQMSPPSASEEGERRDRPDGVFDIDGKAGDKAA